MQILPADIDRDQTYKLLTGVVVPRPIAWVTSLSEAGHVNLAPFSCFTFVSSEPPMLGISIGRGDKLRIKDTARNIRERREFTVNIANDSMIVDVHASSFEFPTEVSEVEKLGLATLPGECIATPRLRDVPVSLECRFSQLIEFGTASTEFHVGEVVCFHIRDDLYEGGKIRTERLEPICRIAGPNYAKLGTIITQSGGAWGPRPKT
ncbi:flavin reductase family protein [Ferrovibrio sp.]|uniref:flavin reductase family protein n=1 Tax=Ferrovibrio sp. TaxID=1917215 RepID=UPI003D09AD23